VSNNTASDNQGIFINGKKQIIELLQFLPPEDKARLLQNMQNRNPVMTKELQESSLSFDNIYNLDDSTLMTIFSYINPAIIVLSLKNTPGEFQRRILSIIPRQNAEQAYNTLSKDIPNENRDNQRAQRKIIDTTITLSKKRIISL
jgi:flagellar motor switch protein FliG